MHLDAHPTLALLPAWAHQRILHVRRQLGPSLRVEWPATRIARSDDPLGVIAVRAGFFDQSHFTRWFKRHTGVTPSQYRLSASAHSRDQL